LDSVLSLLVLNLALAATLMFAVWVVSLRIQDVSIIDIAWGPAGALLAVSSFVLAGGYMPRKILITALTVLWGARLGLHIAARKKGKGEDFRYVAMRERNPDTFPVRSLFTVFFLQAVLIWVVSLPVQVAQVPDRPPALGILDYLGLAVWLVGFTFETVSDHQLKRFLSDPSNRNRVMDQGLWRYSRHPNYFGDALVWWGLFLVAAASPRGWLTVISPILMTFLLTRVSGVPLLDDALEERRPGYGSYMERTSSFIPWPPKKDPGPGSQNG
jgi:steroid 5-alpha reductase family enzyme